MKNFLTTMVALGVLVWAGSATAATIVDLYGDKDGFGLGLTNGYTQPTWPEAPIVQSDAADVGTITDMKLFADQTWSHTFDISGLGPITSASVEIMTFAQGYTGESTLYLDGSYVGTLTDGDTTSGAADSDSELNIAWIDTFDISSLAGSLLDGASELRIDTAVDGDWWYLDYSELTITDARATVPEPSTMLLLGSGLAGLAWYNRKRKKA